MLFLGILEANDIVEYFKKIYIWLTVKIGWESYW